MRGPTRGVSTLSTQAQAPTGARILDGYRVVDCSEGIAGPVATLLLAEAGADVVKVERPGGDPARSSLGFLTWNRSKRSVVLDLDTSEGRGNLDDLLRGADVLVHGFGPARAAEIGLTDDDLRRRHPHLVTSSVLAWPVGHPSADGPIDDLLVSARLGLCDEQLGHREGPVFLRFPFGSWCAVYLAAVGILARLVHRGRGGPAGPANTSVAQGALVPTMMHWARADHPGEMFAFGLPKELQPSLFECGDGVWIHLMRNADVDSPLMAQALADLGAEGVAKANAAFYRHLHARLPQPRRQPGGIPHEAQPGMAGRLLVTRHPRATGRSVRSHPGGPPGAGQRLRGRSRRSGPRQDRPGRHPVLDRASLSGERSGSGPRAAHRRGALRAPGTLGSPTRTPQAVRAAFVTNSARRSAGPRPGQLPGRPARPHAAGRPRCGGRQGGGHDRGPDAPGRTGLRRLPARQEGPGTRPEVAGGPPGPGGARPLGRRGPSQPPHAGSAPAGPRLRVPSRDQPRHRLLPYQLVRAPRGPSGLARLRPAVPGRRRDGRSWAAEKATTRCGSGSASWTTSAPWGRWWPPCWRCSTATAPGRARA